MVAPPKESPSSAMLFTYIAMLRGRLTLDPSGTEVHILATPIPFTTSQSTATPVAAGRSCLGIGCNGGTRVWPAQVPRSTYWHRQVHCKAPARLRERY